MSDTENLLLKTNLKQLRLPTMKAEYDKLAKEASSENATFHDLRRTCITNWFANGLSEYEVMRLAGHACFSTTHAFYLAVREDLIDRGRAASTKVMAAISVANLLQGPSECHDPEE